MDARREVDAPEAVDVRLGGVAFLVNRAAGLGLGTVIYGIALFAAILAAA